jgi:hypothetical protein
LAQGWTLSEFDFSGGFAFQPARFLRSFPATKGHESAEENRNDSAAFRTTESGLFDNPPELAHQSSPERH